MHLYFYSLYFSKKKYIYFQFFKEYFQFFKEYFQFLYFHNWLGVGVYGIRFEVSRMEQLELCNSSLFVYFINRDSSIGTLYTKLFFLLPSFLSFSFDCILTCCACCCTCKSCSCLIFAAKLS